MDWTQDFGMEIRSVLQKNQKLNAHIDKTGASLCGQDLPKTGLCKRSNCIFQRDACRNNAATLRHDCLAHRLSLFLFALCAGFFARHHCVIVAVIFQYKDAFHAGSALWVLRADVMRRRGESSPNFGPVNHDKLNSVFNLDLR